MGDFNEMTVTIKLKSYEFQPVCELINRIRASDDENKDDIELNLKEKSFVSSVFKRIADAGRRKANKLEAIGSEVINSMDFANCK